MESLTVDQLERVAGSFDRLVSHADYLDPFCSSTSWIVPAAIGLMPDRTPWLWRGDSGYAALMIARHSLGFVYAEPLEAMWGLGCPLVGEDVVALTKELIALSKSNQQWDLLVLSGLLDEAPERQEVCEALESAYQLQAGPVTVRFVASLLGGFDGFLSRRTRNFRRSLSRSARRVAEAGITFESASVASIADADHAFERVLAVERQSWKGRGDTGITAPPMYGFYRAMLPRLAATGRLRLLFAKQDERDVAYVLGGVFGDRYRGLQFSYADHLRDLGLGNVTQAHQIEHLCAEGVVHYDLGATGTDYKSRWAEQRVCSTMIVVVDG
jgi:CelD/BcsL family acetyltransferase involved in cellulose biosynthesis